MRSATINTTNFSFEELKRALNDTAIKLNLEIKTSTGMLGKKDKKIDYRASSALNGEKFYLHFELFQNGTPLSPISTGIRINISPEAGNLGEESAALRSIVEELNKALLANSEAHLRAKLRN